MKLRVFRGTNPGLTLNPMTGPYKCEAEGNMRHTKRRRRCEDGDKIGVM